MLIVALEGAQRSNTKSRSPIVLNITVSANFSPDLVHEGPIFLFTNVNGSLWRSAKPVRYNN